MPRDSSRAARLLAEFLVIVVGVLVALAVDRWSTSLDDRKAEAEYIAALTADLTTTQENIQVQVARLRAARDAGLAVLDVMEGRQDAVPTRVVINSYQATQSATSFEDDFVTATYEELIQTRGLRLLQDAELRRTLVRYFQLGSVASFRASLIPTEFRDIVRGLLPLDVQEGIRAGCTRQVVPATDCALELDANQARELTNALVQHPESAPHLRRLVSQLTNTISAISNDLERTDQLIGQLRNQIG